MNSNRSFDYNYQLNELKQIDSDLFKVLETFLTEWSNFDYNDKSPFAVSYNTLLHDFTAGLEKWTEGKTIR